MKVKLTFHFHHFTLSGNLSEDLCAVEFVVVAGVNHPLSQIRLPTEARGLKSMSPNCFA